jgi:FkbM family methyltransferase
MITDRPPQPPTADGALTTYAQNFEDVMLWRALKGIPAGFYIDIGAQDPVIDSVSLAFYEHGWRGVHVEPNRHYAGKLRAARPDEEVIEAAIAAAGPIAFFEIPESGLSTADAALAERHRRDGYEVVRTEVPSVTLAALLERYGGRDVHWLKIDVEGLEGQVIDSWGDCKARPWIVVVESTRPRTQIAAAEWEPALLARGYKLVYGDGLNRYYLAEAHRDLEPCFASGPNTFDDFVIAETSYCARPLARKIASLQQQLDLLKDAYATQEATRGKDLTLIGELREAYDSLRHDHIEAIQTALLQREDAAEALRRLEEMRQFARQISARLDALEASRSWRWTGPLRRLARLLGLGGPALPPPPQPLAAPVPPLPMDAAPPPQSAPLPSPVQTSELSEKIRERLSAVERRP